ncbi:lysophospholipid acyltransferase family protein [Meiothermus sp.]|uniref:lysophospholipid acyltransferase family protein n=1 Tax=Meiothermus sp. TaxID=1955249 RepID=UPI0025D369D1|nr:lysophospholipid acyltransferase family protein [Meiothermus sp.]
MRGELRPTHWLLRLGFHLLFRRSLRRGLRGVWIRGGLPGGACVLASNHHSWWDSYLLPVLLSRSGRPFRVVVGEARLREFPFFRYLETVPANRPREALRALGRGEVLVLFPEGELRPPGALGELRPGAVWLARKAGVQVVPVASRVVLRGHEFPEAYLVFGEPVEPELDLLGRALGEALGLLDDLVRTSPAEEPLPGFSLALPGRRSTHERMARWGAWLGRLVGGGG